MGATLADTTFARAPGLLGPIFEEAGTGERQMREALFLTFNVDLGFFETRLLGPVRSTGAAVTVVADSRVFAPDPRNVRSAGHAYALGLAATPGAFHPKLTILVGPYRALVGIGSGNLTVGGWHSNDEVLTTIRASRDDGAPTILHDVVRFLRNLPQRVTISPLAVDGIGRTADHLAALLDVAEPVDTGHAVLDSVHGPILAQLPNNPIDALEMSAPFHDLGARALSALIARFRVAQVTVLAQSGRAVMDPAAMQQAAAAAGCRLSFVQIDGDQHASSRYRHGKVLTGLNQGRSDWTLVGSANMSAAALLGRAPTANVEIAVLHSPGISLLPSPTVPVSDVSALHYRLAVDGKDGDSSNPVVPTLIEARAVADGVEVTLSSSAEQDMAVEVSPYAASPDTFAHLGVIPAGSSSTVFRAQFGPGTRIRAADHWQFLAFPEHVIKRLQPTGAGRPNRDTTMAEIFTSDAAAHQWQEALTRLLLTHGRAARPGVVAASDEDRKVHVAATWRTLEEKDTWADYAEDALARLGMPIFRLAAGASASPAAVGASLPNSAPAWEDRFDETTESFEEGQTVETVEHLDDVLVTPAPTALSSYQRSRLRRWVIDVVELMPVLGPYERIAVCQLAVSGSAAVIWDETASPAGWFAPLADALGTMNGHLWPTAAANQAAAVTALGLYRLRMAVPADERGEQAKRFLALSTLLQPITSTATADTITENLELLAGTSFVAPTAKDVLEELSRFVASDPRKALDRVLERVLPNFASEWLDDHRVHLAGRSSNPRAIAVEALRHANEIASLAVGVTADSGAWAVIGKIPGRVSVIEGGKKGTTFKTYDTSSLNAIVILTEQEQAQQRRISSPPLNSPGDVDWEVLHALDLDEGPMTF